MRCSVELIRMSEFGSGAEAGLGDEGEVEDEEEEARDPWPPEDKEKFEAQESAAQLRQAKLSFMSSGGRVCAEYWAWLKPVLMRKGPGKPLQCRLVCNRGGEAVCGKDPASDTHL